MASSALVVISPAYVEPVERSFALQEKVFSLADSFDIKDADGAPAFKLEGKSFSFHETKTLLDRSGKALAVIKKKALSLHGTWDIYAADGETVVASVKDKVFAIKAHADVIVHQFGSDPYLHVKGDFRGKDFQILQGEKVVATVQRRSIFKDPTRFFTGNDHYSLTVAPHVDQAFSVALAIVLDAIFHSDDSD